MKSHTVRLDNRIVVYKLYVMTGNNVPFFDILLLFYLTGLTGFL